MNPILLLHGALGAKAQLDPLKKLLEKSSRSVYSMNFSGHGGEAFQSSFGIETFAKDIIRYMNELNISTADIFGYSMGGYVAVWLALQQPMRVGYIITLGTKFDWSPDSAEREVKKLNAEKILEKIPAFARILEHRHQPNNWQELMTKTGDMMINLGNDPLLTEQNIKTILQPTEICLGDQDDMADRIFSEKVADWMPNGKFHGFSNTPHPIEKVDLVKLTNIIDQ